MDSEDLGFYYEHLYPYDTIYHWLTYNETIPFIRRQLSFEYQNGSVQRYVTFRNAEKMKERMTQLQNIPRKVDAGAVWTGIPTKQNKQDRPQQRQLIFDFDMNDYDDVRTCCQGKTTCSLCWKLLLVAIQIISTCLKEDFGFEKFMYVFSGGRGIHIWVCDKRARLMKDSVRKAIIDYLEIVTGNDKAASLLADNIIKPHFQVFKQKDPSNKQKIKENIISTMHPHVIRSLSVIKKWFNEIFNDQEPLLEEKCKEVIIKILQARSEKLKKRIEERWQKCEKKSSVMYRELCEEVSQYQVCSDAEYPQPDYQRSKKFKRMTFIEEEIQMSFLYPRMDYNVSTMQNHLLKLPFSVHPSTKNISVPLFSHRIHQFDPKACIKLNDLIKDLQQLYDEGLLKGCNNIEKAKKTRLNEFVTAMQKFCIEL